MQQARQFPLSFYIQKSGHFTLRNFPWKFCGSHLCTKSMILCVTWSFMYKNPNILQKARQFALCFYIQTSRHFALCNFSLNFWNWLRGGGTFLYGKTRHFTEHFYIKITMYFALRIDIKNPYTLGYIFFEKQCTLCYIFIFNTSYSTET